MILRRSCVLTPNSREHLTLISKFGILVMYKLLILVAKRS